MQPGVACGNEQTRPHTPQCMGSTAVSTLSSTAPSQSLSMKSQISSPLGVQAYSQPVDCIMSRSTNPGSQSAAGSNWHMPATQVTLAWKKPQTVPQVPQLVSSLAKSVSSSISPSQSLSNPSQASTPPLDVKQAYSHPFDTSNGWPRSPSRSTNPGKHSWITHAESTHSVRAPSLEQTT